MYEILNNREVIKIAGSDSLKFLQNLTTNDINKKIVDCKDEYKIAYFHQELNMDSLVTARDPRYNLLGFRSITLSQSCHSRIGGNLSKKLYLDDKYNFAIVDGVDDLTVGKSIPTLYGIEELKGVSYDKGCYVGQEVISRAKYQGVIRRKIYKIIAEEDLSSLIKDEEILAGNDSIGIICSSYQNKAIALVKEEKYLASKEEDITVRGIKIGLSLAPWYV
ncbi:putative transferase caf17, mitochondrial [Chrysoperla carnea]|uniref:putative transferase caf17, mitochondrial n=1 Tax=Chrysoperla carnea TaxID=189513 RepID=UPI001D0860CE|nr:putative transferase caf17, mitochondrial [Chrysoperla carnea]